MMMYGRRPLSTLPFASKGGNAGSQLNRFKLVRALDPDVVLCNASAGEISGVGMAQHEWHVAVNTTIKRLSKEL